jgi:hypothetical protein
MRLKMNNDEYMITITKERYHELLSYEKSIYEKKHTVILNSIFSSYHIEQLELLTDNDVIGQLALELKQSKDELKKFHKMTVYQLIKFCFNNIEREII